MADIKFACPHCNQHITCDALWGGHELQCPGCQNTLVVPGTAAAAPEAPASLVPVPPSGGVAKVSISRPQAHATQASASAPANKSIPIRNLAPAATKKQSPAVKIAVGAAVVVALAAGGYFGFVWVSDYQAKLKAKSAEAEKNSDGGQVGHIAELNAVMDATDPSKSSSGPRPGRRERQSTGAAPAG
ncbi:MAG TPA: hypothetical protein VHI52_14560, partial [Verrucomicrobiae bacterium]|nr:hypothetical protein [Verrucomicrobiae bacterium]